MTVVWAPLAGRVVGLAAVPDPVFSAGLVGPGTAVDPVRRAGDVLSPVDGRVVSLHPHAFVVVDAEGHGVLTHLGVDTVQLAGRGFELLADEGEVVVHGQPLVRWDPVAVVASGRSAVCPVIALAASAEALAGVAAGREVAAGGRLFEWSSTGT